jgi:hypothetical protein
VTFAETKVASACTTNSKKVRKNDWNVAEWKANRFSPRYPEFDVAVLDGDNNEVHGLTKLGTVRDSYSEE